MAHAGSQTFIYDNPPLISAHTSIVGPKEGQGPLAKWFDIVLEDDLYGQKTFELAECAMLKRCISEASKSAGIPEGCAQALLSGDLNDQIIATSFAARDLKLPLIGLYGACSTFIQGIVIGAALISGGMLENCLAAASSHFCTAERQFRFPLELGTQRPPAAHWTTTAAGCVALKNKDPESKLKVVSGTLGRVIDYDIKDANNMGAAMAPAVAAVIEAHMRDCGTCAADYDLIATGDLGWIGRNILMEVFKRREFEMPHDKLIDCGGSIFYAEQDTHAGGSGCGCIASVASGWIMKRMEAGELGRVLLVGSGAMMSPTSSMQAQSIPGMAYAVEIKLIEGR